MNSNSEVVFSGVLGSRKKNGCRNILSECYGSTVYGAHLYNELNLVQI